MSAKQQHLAKQFDTRIAEGREVVRRLREERNESCSATSSLPPEILLTIFEFLSQPHSFCSSKSCSDPFQRPLRPKVYQKYALVYSDALYGHSDKCANAQYGKLKWTRVARVCRKWRTVALGSPSLWTKLHYLPTRSLQKIAKRYPDTPLDIDCSLEGLQEITQAFGGKSLDLSRRIRRLILLLDASVINVTIFSCPLPVLQSLTMSGPFDFPKSFFDAHIPSLKSASLQLRQVPLDAHMLSNLQQLTLSGEWNSVLKNQREPLVADDFLSLLQRQPRLQALTFTLPANTSNYSAPSEARTVQLSFLKEISIKSLKRDQGPWFQILRHIDCPRLESFSSSLVTHSPSGILPHERLAPLEAIHSFFIDHGTYLTKQRLIITPFLIQLYDNFDSPTPPWNLQPRLTIEVESKFPATVQWETFLEFITNQNIPVACLDCRDLDRELPKSICDSIQVLRLASGVSLHCFLRALDNHGAFTSLECVHFHRVSFAPRGKTIPAIKRWHSERCAAGRHKVMFILHLCGISYSNVQALKRSKCEVRWDGQDLGQ
ncbi:hypothetical protein EYR38_006288 [Pleurotus pulmonarius]|nr:hypothetical protein EYR38_006288 [Pleurotus pulmonarius]